jgi:hypothetical protein
LATCTCNLVASHLAMTRFTEGMPMLQSLGASELAG